MKRRTLNPLARFLRDNLTPERWATVEDPRKPRGVRYKLVGLLKPACVGPDRWLRTLRDVERLGMKLAVGRASGCAARPRTRRCTPWSGGEPRGPDSGPRGPSQGAVAEQAHAGGLRIGIVGGHRRQVPGRGPRAQAPESTGIAVPASDRLEAALEAQRDEGHRCQAGNLQLPDMDPGPDGRSTWSRPSEPCTSPPPPRWPCIRVVIRRIAAKRRCSRASSGS